MRLALLLAVALLPGCFVFVLPLEAPGGDAGITQPVTLADGGTGYVLPDGGVAQSLVEPVCQVSPLQTSAGTPVTFDGQSSQGSPGAEVVAWSWTFGDGASGQGALTSHAYADAGSFVATLTATDSVGQTGSISCSAVTVSP